MATPRCAVCRDGVLNVRTRFRHGPTVAAVGWALLVPALVGLSVALLGGACRLVVTEPDDRGLDATRLERSSAEYGPAFDQLGLPRALLELAVRDPDAVDDELLTGRTQRERVLLECVASDARIDRSAGRAGIEVLGGLRLADFGLVAGVALAAAAIGAGLVRRSSRLVCGSCGSAVEPG